MNIKIFLLLLSYRYLCEKLSFTLSLQKNNYFLSFQSPIFHLKSQKHLACKINKDEQGGTGRKLEVLGEHTF